jgi:hypothetical protein
MAERAGLALQVVAQSASFTCSAALLSLRGVCTTPGTGSSDSVATPTGGGAIKMIRRCEWSSKKLERRWQETSTCYGTAHLVLASAFFFA